MIVLLRKNHSMIYKYNISYYYYQLLSHLGQFKTILGLMFLLEKIFILKYIAV